MSYIQEYKVSQSLWSLSNAMSIFVCFECDIEVLTILPVGMAAVACHLFNSV